MNGKAIYNMFIKPQAGNDEAFEDEWKPFFLTGVIEETKMKDDETSNKRRKNQISKHKATKSNNNRNTNDHGGNKGGYMPNYLSVASNNNQSSISAITAPTNTTSRSCPARQPDRRAQLEYRSIIGSNSRSTTCDVSGPRRAQHHDCQP